jgi:hypothetical protein
MEDRDDRDSGCSGPPSPRWRSRGARHLKQRTQRVDPSRVGRRHDNRYGNDGQHRSGDDRGTRCSSRHDRHNLDPPPAPTPAADVLAAINQHWLDITNGDYHAAFQLLLPSADGNSTESTWVASHNQDGITNVTYHFTVAWVNGNNARVNADTLTTQDATGCHTFSGHYLMSQQSGSWLIAQVFLTVAGC